MADIRVEEKKSSSILPWILGVVGLVLLGWLAVDFFDADGEPELLTADEVNFPDGDFTDRPDADLVNAQDQEGVFDMNGDQKSAVIVSDDNLRALTGQLDEMVGNLNLRNDRNVTASLNKLKTATAGVYDGDGDTNEDLKTAAMAVSNLLDQIQRKKFPEMSTAVIAVRNDASNIDEDNMLTFYDNVRRTITDMDNAEDIYGTDAS